MNRKIITSSLLLGTLAFAGVASAGHNPASVDIELGTCAPTKFTATITDPAGTHKVANMFLVVDTESDLEQSVNIPTDGSSVALEVGPFDTDTVVSWNVFGGGERSYDQPLWNGFGGATFGADITSYAAGVGGFSWVTAGTDDPNPFVNWNEVLVPACEPLIDGGGHILEDNGEKRKAWNDISFGTEVFDLGDSYDGHLNIVFHNTSDEAVTGGHFNGTDIEQVTLFDGDSASCHAAMNMTVNGTFNGEEGWRVVFRAGDSPDNPGLDTVRVTLLDGNTVVYDSFGPDFTPETTCVGSARTGLDTGNLTIND